MSDKPTMGHLTFGPGMGDAVTKVEVKKTRTKVTCQKCGERPGTEIFTESTVAYVHGMFAMWCRLCVAREQLATAEKLAATIPALRAKIEELEAAGE